MRRSLFPRPGSLIIIAVMLALAASAAAMGADRPRLRPTPATSAAPSAAPGSPVPDVSPAPLPSPDLPAGAGCFGLERPDPASSFQPATSLPPGASVAPSVEPTPTPKPTPAADADETTRYKLKVVGIRLDLPADWVGLEGDDLATLEDVPELTETLAAIEASSLVFLGVDVLPGEGCVVGGNLSLYDLGEAVDPWLLALTVEAIALALEELEEVRGDVKVSSVDLPVGEAQRLTFRFDATEDGALTAWWVRADVFTASGRTLLAAYAAPEEIAADAKPAFTAIAKSIREL